YVRITNDYYRLVSGNIYNATSLDKLTTVPDWVRCEAERTEGEGSGSGQRRLQSTASPTVNPCSNTWTYESGMCYKLFTEALSWNAARSSCEEAASGGQLASVASFEVNQAIPNHGSELVWLGGYDDGSDSWEWSDESAFSYQNWAADEPKEQEGCLALDPSREWHERSCFDEEYYVCQYSHAGTSKVHSKISFGALSLDSFDDETSSEDFMLAFKEQMADEAGRGISDVKINDMYDEADYGGILTVSSSVHFDSQETEEGVHISFSATVEDDCASIFQDEPAFSDAGEITSSDVTAVVASSTATDSPITMQTSYPTAAPTASPSAAPTAAPTASPTAAPTAAPAVAPTASPTAAPTASPSAAPTAAPTASPTAAPTAAPAVAPTASPTAALDSLLQQLPPQLPASLPHSCPDSFSISCPHSCPDSLPHSCPDSCSSSGPDSLPHSCPDSCSSSGPDSLPHSCPDSSISCPHSCPRQLLQQWPRQPPHSCPDSLPHSCPHG
ncbi:hypothetical protein CYMTET_24840, partial [Cymbomonas tetramitiformis]